MDELTIGDKTYISSKKAAQITGYAKDYVGQLCREGHVEAKMVGRNWYVLESSIREHRFGADPKKESTTMPKMADMAGTNGVNGPAAASIAWEAPKYVTEPLVPMPSLARPDSIYIPESAMAAPAPSQPGISDETASETLTDMQSAWKEWFARKQEAESALETPQIIDSREAAGEIGDRATQRYQYAEPLLEAEDADEYAEEADTEPEPVVIHRQQSAQRPVYEPQMYAEELEDEEPVAIHRAPAFAPTPALAYEEPIAAIQRSYASPIAASAPVPVRSIYDYEEQPVAEYAGPRSHREAVLGELPRKEGSSTILRTLLVAIILVVGAIAIIGTGFGDKFDNKQGVAYKAIHFFNGSTTYTSSK